MNHAPISFGPVAPVLADPTRTVDRVGMYDTIREFLTALMTQRSERGGSVVHPRPDGLTFEALLETEPVPGGRPQDQRCRYELRTTELILPEKGIVGVANRRDLWENLEFNMWHSFGVLVSEQPQAQFALVAARVEPFGRDRTVTSIAGGSRLQGVRPLVEGWTAEAEASDGVSAPRRGGGGRPESRVVQEPQVSIVLVWSDIAQTQFVDPNAAHTSNRDTPVRDYIETRILSRAPSAWKMQRATAVATIRKTMEENAPAAVVPPPMAAQPSVPAPPPGLSFETLAQRVRDGVPLETVANILGLGLEETAQALGVPLREELPARKRRTAE